MTYTRLIDVSWYQRFFQSWSELPALQIKGAYLKASEGAGYRDAAFDQHKAHALPYMTHLGAYHLAHGGNVAQQVENFWQASGGLGSEAGELPPALDVERATNPPGLDDVQAMLGLIEERWGCVPVIYGGQDYLGKLGLDAHCPLWLSAYPPEYKGGKWPAELYEMPGMAPWGPARIWQFSETMPLPGPGGLVCDASVFGGDEAALAAFCDGSRV